MLKFVKASLAALVLGAVALSGLAQDSKLKGEIKIDGSSTVYLITEAMATHFKKLHPGVNISVGISGTGGGFKKFAAGETDISDASRAIKDAEAKKCKENNIEFTELQIAWDGLAVIINKDNNWATKMTVEQLKKIWHPDSKAQKWSDVDPKWPAMDIKLYGAGPDSGTFDYFTEAINGKEKVSRTDYVASEDDNTTINGVLANKGAMGYLGVAYYEAHKQKLGIVAVAPKAGADYVLPTNENVLSKKYSPLGRPLFIYVKNASLKREEVRGFVQFYNRRGDIVGEAKYVPLSSIQQLQQRKRLDAALKTIN
ncbi:MAG: PstS family phosphate ABC transporter substrate-binding protein [Gemmataceae bacterium]|nr:PstS family phosphate ABC transporter substrate-binding protein [Gemmataceae bacterium]MCI0741779.1 PstS family phosphate ABC transporter substrate-binding protein [Gemmataceae bacterium]